VKGKKQMWNPFRKTNPIPVPIPAPIPAPIAEDNIVEEPSPFVSSGEFDQAMSKVKVDLVNAFLKNTIRKSDITDQMRKDAIQKVLAIIPVRAGEAISRNANHIYIFAPVINPTGQITTSLEQSIFSDIAKDVQAILKAKNINSTISDSKSDGYIKITLGDLKQYSNVEKLGALQ